jgi:hypothetical protein
MRRVAQLRALQPCGCPTTANGLGKASVACILSWMRRVAQLRALQPCGCPTTESGLGKARVACILTAEGQLVLYHHAKSMMANTGLLSWTDPRAKRSGRPHHVRSAVRVKSSPTRAANRCGSEGGVRNSIARSVLAVREANGRLQHGSPILSQKRQIRNQRVKCGCVHAMT